MHLSSIKHPEKWTLSILSGLFMFVVLYVYKGYNIDQIDSLSGHSLLVRAIAFGLLTSLVFYLGEFHVKRLIRPFSVLQKIAFLLGEVIICLNLIFLLFNYFWNWTELYWSSYLMFWYEFPLVVIFPILFSLLIGQNRHSATQKDDYLVITSENGKEHFRVKPQQLLYLKSTDNYVEIFHLSNGQVKAHLLRKSFKEIEQEYPSSPYLVRSHRSYMVNPQNVDHTEHKGKSMKLTIAGAEIPVSGSYLHHFQ